MDDEIGASARKDAFGIMVVLKTLANSYFSYSQILLDLLLLLLLLKWLPECKCDRQC